MSSAAKPNGTERELPSWEPRATRQLGALQRQLTLLGAATPFNLRRELAALEEDFAAGRPRMPRFRYGSAPKDARPALLNLLRQLRARPEPLAELYAARADEMRLEAELCQSAGQHGFVGWAQQRYAPLDDYDERAMPLAEAWARLAPEPDEPLLRSDDEREPGSLLRRMRAEVGRRRLPFRVEVSARLAALAATGAGVIYVASGKLMRAQDVERTVLHEVKGHAMPRVAAARCAVGLATLGSARGSDEQEGRALLLEQRAELLCPHRQAELGRRHLAARAAHERATYIDAVALLRERGCPLTDALRICARAYRGGGLGRERAYLPALLRVRDALAEQPELEPLLASGKLSVAAARKLQQIAPALAAQLACAGA